MFKPTVVRNIILFVFLLATLSGCQLKWKSIDFSDESSLIVIQRYDRLESAYLTTADYSALQQMSTDYPIETRTLIENVLQLGEINDAEINKKFLQLFQDSSLQTLISDVEAEYANVDDLNEQLNRSFNDLRKYLKDIHVPMIYTQISALDQSIIIGDQSIGISLDKYMGQNYPLYKRFYTQDQAAMMHRNAIVPDCLCFYLVSLYPMVDFDRATQTSRDIYISRIQWIVNKVTKGNFFKNEHIDELEEQFDMSDITVEELLNSTDYSTLIPENS